MNRARPKRKILLVCICALLLLAAAPVAIALGGEESEADPQAAAVAGAPVDEAVEVETSALRAEAISGLPFTNFDLLALMAVLLGVVTLSLAVHILNRDPGERDERPPITTDAE